MYLHVSKTSQTVWKRYCIYSRLDNFNKLFNASSIYHAILFGRRPDCAALKPVSDSSIIVHDRLAAIKKWPVLLLIARQVTGFGSRVVLQAAVGTQPARQRGSVRARIGEPDEE
jgi:hypothetical protein